MRKIMFLMVAISVMCLISKGSLAQTPDWLWVKSAGGTNSEESKSVAVDDSGNTYIAGLFNSPSITFGSVTLSNKGSFDIFLAKYDANGNVLWAKGFGGMGDDEASSVSVDASGNIYVAGYFSSSIISFGFFTLTNADVTGNTFDLFLVKFDTEGEITWAKSAGGTSNDGILSTAISASGTIYATGCFYSASMSLGPSELINADNSGYTEDIFLAKYDSDGNVLWAKSAGGTGDDGAFTVALNNPENVIVAGNFWSSEIMFGSTTFTNANFDSTADVFLAKYDADGNVLWAKSAGGTSDDYANSVAMDFSGNIFVTGCFYSPTINFGTYSLINFDNLLFNDIYLVKYDPNGNVLWAKSAGGQGLDEANSVTLDALEDIYVTGYFDSPTIVFGSFTLTNAGGIVDPADIFLVKYDVAGNVVWATGAGGMGTDVANSVKIDATDNAFVTGYFGSSSMTFGSTTLINAGENDLFLAKSDVITGIETSYNSLSLKVFPNPASEAIKIIFPEKAILEILDIKGQVIRTINHGGLETTVELTGILSGLYFIKAKTEKGTITTKFIKK